MFPQQIFESSKPFSLLGRRLDNSITTCCSLELWPQALGTDVYLIQRREVCAYQHQPTSTSLFPQNGFSHPSNYLRSFDWNVGTQVFPPKLTLHFQDTLYDHGLEFVIGKCRIKLHKINFFLTLTLIFFSLRYPWLPVGCLPLFLLKWQKKREQLLICEVRVRLQRMRRWEEGNSVGKQQKTPLFWYSA